MSEAELDETDDLIGRLQRTASAYEEAQKRVEEAGENRLERLAEHYREITALMNRYEGRSTSDGDGDVDMEAFIEYQEELAHFVDHLPEDLPHRSAFEEVDEIMHQKWLKESDFQAARDALSEVGDLVERLDERERARERHAEARQALERHARALEDRIEDLEHLSELGDADLQAPVERLRDPIEAYNDAVTDAFERFRHDASAQQVLAFVDAVESLPLIEYRQPPPDLREYIENNEVGTEPIRTLLEYADYSKSKLDHYVDSAEALKRHVATHQTYLRRLDADPLTVSWPPPEAETLRWRSRERIRAVDRFADEETLLALRTVRDLPDREDYERLRTSAVARTQLTDDERERLARGDVDTELQRRQEARERVSEALSEDD